MTNWNTISSGSLNSQPRALKGLLPLGPVEALASGRVCSRACDSSEAVAVEYKYNDLTPV